MKSEKKQETIKYIQELISNKEQRKQLLENAEKCLDKIGIPMYQPQIIAINMADLNIRP